MKKTSLSSFYEYIIKNFVFSSDVFPEFDDVIKTTPLSDVDIDVIRLYAREQSIWADTKKVINTYKRNINEALEMMETLMHKSAECDLCAECQKCETEYWTELQKILKQHSGLDPEYKPSALQLPYEVTALFSERERPVDVYLNHYIRRTRQEGNFLVMLKGFSSSTPILLNYAKDTNFYSGGGFYFRWNGTGVAVDPGYLFLQNLQNYGLTVLDIDVVIITHEHIDHSSDMRLLDDLHYNVASNYKVNLSNWDAEEFMLANESEFPHVINWYMDEVTCEEAISLKNRHSGFNDKYNRLYCVAPNNNKWESLQNKFGDAVCVLNEFEAPIGDDIILNYFGTAHEQYKQKNKSYYFDHTYGCVFCCKSKTGDEQRKIGYTSDTSVQPDLYTPMLCELRGCHILIANISGIYLDDILLQNNKPRHLGYNGCYKIFYDLLNGGCWNLRYFLLSEFSNQVSDIRFVVSKYMQTEFNRITQRKGLGTAMVLPTETGLTLDLDRLKIRCDICNGYADKMFVMKPIGENNKLQYVCSQCMYTDE